jgi:hypothetical protein
MRRIRNLSLAVMAVLALAASVSAASASASRFITGEYPATVTATQNSMFIGFIGGTNCSGTYGYGELEYGAFGHAATNVSVPPPATSSCTGKYGASLTAKNCQFNFNPTNETFGLTSSECTLDFHSKSPLCTYRMGPQTIAAEFKNESGSPSTVRVNTTGTLHYTRIEGSEALCGKVEGNLTFIGEWHLAAYNGGGKQTSLSLTDDVGFWFNGETSKFEAEAYPLHVEGAQDAANPQVVKLRAGIYMKCGSVTFKQVPTVGASTSELPVYGPGYSECTSLVAGVSLKDTVAMNSCYYVFHGGEWPAEGTVDIVCEEETEPIEITILKKDGTVACKYQIGTQEGLTGASYTTVNEGVMSGVDITLNLEGIKIKRVGGSEALCGPSEASTTTYKGGETLYQQ